MLNKARLGLIGAFMLVIVSGCGTSDPELEETGSPDGQGESTESHGEVSIVTMTMENGDEVVMELYPEVAPITVDNFVTLAGDGFYDGLTFHRVIPGFMVQGGDPEGTGTGGPGHSIEGEFSSNGFENDLAHERGVLSMARSQDPDSAGSQFFIMVEDTPSLDGDYAAFGKVIEGMEYVDEIVSVDTDGRDMPVEGQEQVIESMTVE
ncbi:peptidylprolyl isomerase [Alkalicoccobacillus porphyridii]|uniref:Peptidyl-prolyl cis-trans isomerase n=1 Tax=Alkalicoccobacillus porphyridii TaxID=2597270 RepID=A0A554A1M4_9BACI|nr:peptidylprolyl isomerase [Alkalicoccobacillus porphyridii]TSB47579.1 peptidylprolyl isomerase [Alkalicoccobacillus porphyridii]